MAWVLILSKRMSEDGSSQKKKSFVEGLKSEWSLLWGTLEPETSEVDLKEIEPLNAEQLKAISKILSQDRKRVYQKIETLNKEVELNSAKLESLKLVGSESTDTLERLNLLADQGQSLSNELAKLDEKLRIARQKQEDLLSDNEN